MIVRFVWLIDGVDYSTEWVFLYSSNSCGVKMNWFAHSAQDKPFNKGWFLLRVAQKYKTPHVVNSVISFLDFILYSELYLGSLQGLAHRSS